MPTNSYVACTHACIHSLFQSGTSFWKNLFVQNLFFLSQKREMIAKVIIEYNSISRHIVCFWKPAPELLATVLISVIYPSLHCDLFFRVYTHELV